MPDTDKDQAAAPRPPGEPKKDSMIPDSDMAAGGSDAHKRSCAARYKTYDPATDMFYARPGVKKRCRL